MRRAGRASRRRCSGSAGHWQRRRTSRTRYPAILQGLAGETRLSRIWFGRQVAGREVVVADTGSDPPPAPRIHALLTRTPGDLPARWVRAHQPQDRRGRPNSGSGNGAVPGEDRGRRGDAGLDLGDAVAPGRAPRSARKRGCSALPRTRSGSHSRGRNWPRPRMRSRSRGRARRSRTPSWTRSPTTSARRSPRSAPPPAASWIRRSPGPTRERREAARDDRSRGGSAQRARPEPARHEQDRGRRPPAEPRGPRRRRPGPARPSTRLAADLRWPRRRARVRGRIFLAVRADAVHFDEVAHESPRQRG